MPKVHSHRTRRRQLDVDWRNLTAGVTDVSCNGTVNVERHSSSALPPVLPKHKSGEVFAPASEGARRCAELPVQRRISRPRISHTSSIPSRASVVTCVTTPKVTADAHGVTRRCPCGPPDPSRCRSCSRPIPTTVCTPIQKHFPTSRWLLAAPITEAIDCSGALAFGDLL
jgi:hypothetical protein